MYHDIEKAKCSVCDSKSMAKMWTECMKLSIDGSNLSEWSEFYWKWTQKHPIPETMCLVVECDTRDRTETYAICPECLKEIVAELQLAR